MRERRIPVWHARCSMERHGRRTPWTSVHCGRRDRTAPAPLWSGRSGRDCRRAPARALARQRHASALLSPRRRASALPRPERSGVPGLEGPGLAQRRVAAGGTAPGRAGHPQRPGPRARTRRRRGALDDHHGDGNRGALARCAPDESPSLLSGHQARAAVRPGLSGGGRRARTGRRIPKRPCFSRWSCARSPCKRKTARSPT